MATVNTLSEFPMFRGVLVGMIGEEPLLQWNDNSSIHPASWRAAAVPVDGGSPVLLGGQPTVGQVKPVGAFGSSVACIYAKPYSYASGFILSNGAVVPLENVGTRGFYLGWADETGVYGSARGVGAVRWDWSGSVEEVSTTGFIPPAQEYANTFPVPFGYTSFAARSVSPDNRYIAGLGVNLNAPTRLEMQKELLVDTLADSVELLEDVLGVKATSVGLQFTDDGSVVCITQINPSTQSVARISGWEG